MAKAKVLTKAQVSKLAVNRKNGSVNRVLSTQNILREYGSATDILLGRMLAKVDSGLDTELKGNKGATYKTQTALYILRKRGLVVRDDENSEWSLTKAGQAEAA